MEHPWGTLLPEGNLQPILYFSIFLLPKILRSKIHMKPAVDLKRCFASKTVCTAIKCCPKKAISYIEALEPILDKTLNCNCADPNRKGKIPVACTDDGCCDDTGCGNDLYSCGGNPYGRIIIDYSKCNGCGLCAKECCGSAIDMLEAKENKKAACCCNGKC